MNKRCVNCPGAEDHSTAQCPLVSEQKNELRQIITDALVSMVSGVTGLVPPTGPGAIPDFIQAPIDLAVERISASLPVGVPDGWKLAPVEPTPEMVSAAEEAHMPFGDMDIALRMAILSAPAAEQSAPDHIEDSLGMVEQSAPGEVDGPDITTKRGYPAYSVAQHKRIVAQLQRELKFDQFTHEACFRDMEKLRDQLAARDAGEVRVPVELLQRCASRLHNMMQADLEAELRALLAQRERGGA